MKKRSSIEETDENFEPMENIMKVAKLTTGLNLIEAGMNFLADIDSDDQRVAMTRKILEN